MSAHGITLTGYCARWASGLIVEPLGTWDSTGQETLTIESASDEWLGALTATFWGPAAAAGTDMLMTDGTCIVPPEALAAPGNGTVTLRCTNAQGRRISVDLAYHSAGHAQVPGSPSEPTPDLWQQYIQQVQADADRAEQASKDAADSADAAAESAKQAAQATADIGEAKDAALQAIQQAQDTGVQAVQTATTTGVQAVQRAHQAALDDIATDRQQALTDIETEGEKQTSAITSSGAAALEAIGQVEQTAIGQVQQAGTTQVAAVQQAGQAQQTAIEQAGQSWQQQIASAGTAELGRWAPAIWDTAPLAAEHGIYAAEGAPLRVTQQGETQQETTTGAQLFDIDSGEPEENHDGILKFACPLTIGEKYTLSTNGKASISYKISNSRDGYESVGSRVDNANTFTMAKDEHIADNEQQHLYFWLVDGDVQVTDKSQISGLDIMLNAGSTALPWKPYTGGAPSPSPDYPQAIKGAGLNGKIVLDGSADEAWVRDGQAGKYRYCIFDGLPDAVAPDAAIPATCYCNRYRIISGDNTYQGILGLALYADNIYLRDPAITSVESLRAALGENPLEIYYVSSDRSKQSYTVGISTEDDAGGYHGQALAIGSPLYGDGIVVDMVENDVASGCDKVITVDGTTVAFTERTSGDRVYWNLPNNSAPGVTILATGGKFASNSFPGGIWNGNDVYDFIFTNSDKFPQFADVDAINEYCQQLAAAGTPLKIWYRSTAYTEAADLHIDKVTRRWRMVELDGTENGLRLASAGNGNPYYYQLQDIKFYGAIATSVVGWEDSSKSTHFLPGNPFSKKGNLAVAMTHDNKLFCRIGFAPDPFETYQDVQAWLAAQKSAGTPVRVLYQLATPEEYASDPHTLPALGSLPETVKATGQSTVSYSADTKSYIDAKFAALSAAMLGG